MSSCLPVSDCRSFPFLLGRRWIKQMFIGAFLIPAMVCGTAFFINFIAIYYHASRAIPFGTMVSCLNLTFKLQEYRRSNKRPALSLSSTSQLGVLVFAARPPQSWQVRQSNFFLDSVNQ